MKLVLQRVKSASVTVNGKTTGEIQQGLLLFVCFEAGDTMAAVDESIEKVVNLRIFEDEAGKMNLNVKQINGAILSVSQFTLSWDGKKGHRPSFDKSMPPQEAKLMYYTFNKKLEERELKVEKGIFGENMQVSLVNDGPVTFILNF
ncbi:MAG: D-tyrosyl-tRNA(Tyr) deacylase [Bacteriovoracaceae bacterium]|nr:D-tyrosyl-tRNA(Tyr) deacylase [Bacteriovoracaceae bacterium]